MAAASTVSARQALRCLKRALTLGESVITAGSSGRTGCLLLVALALAGCVQTTPPLPTEGGSRECSDGSPGTEECVPEAAPRLPSVLYELAVSGCTEIGHTIRAPPAAFAPDYPKGTTPDSTTETIAYHQTVICEQATDENQTYSPFHVAWFGAAINPPGPTAAGADFRDAGFDLITNNPRLAEVARQAGWRTYESEAFELSFVAPAGETMATPYALRTPASEPIYEFSGTINRASASSQTTHEATYYYTRTSESIFLLRWEDDKRTAGPSQPAAASFRAPSYWSVKSTIPTIVAVNSQDVEANGFIRVESLLEY